MKSWPGWSQGQSCPWHQIKKAGFPLQSPMLFWVYTLPMRELYTAATLAGRIANVPSDLLLSGVRRRALYCFLKKYFWISNVFVFTCGTVWIKCCLLPTHVQMRSCKSSSVLRKGILIWIKCLKSNHMGKSHMGSRVASRCILCSSLLSQIHSNSHQWVTQVSAVCRLTPWRVAGTAHSVVLHKPGSLFFT